MSDFIGPIQAAKILGKSQQWITYLLRSKKLEGVKVGQRWIIERQKVLDYKAAQDAKESEADNAT